MKILMVIVMLVGLALISYAAYLTPGKTPFDWLQMLAAYAAIIVSGYTFYLTRKLQHQHMKQKVQFEHEFKSYVELWEALTELKVSFMKKRPDHILGILKAEGAEWPKLLENALVTINKSQPFLAPDVYEQSMTVWALANPLLYSGKELNLRSKTFAEFLGQIDNVCREIRKRIWVDEKKDYPGHVIVDHVYIPIKDGTVVAEVSRTDADESD